MKAARNKTIDITVKEGQVYLDRCISIDKPAELTTILDKTILGDTFDIISFLPQEFVDLLIVDPPYNLDKDFHGNKYKKTSDDLYEEYTETWIKLILPLLKAKASIYVCCDWQSSPAIGRVLKKYFYIQNRITWQREKGRGSLSNWKNGMEDIWFATNSKTYTFNVEDVKMRRRVIAPIMSLAISYFSFAGHLYYVPRKLRRCNLEWWDLYQPFPSAFQPKRNTEDFALCLHNAY
jgi:site-specific DNA-methyltransferase (adenine-specific)